MARSNRSLPDSFPSSPANRRGSAAVVLMFGAVIVVALLIAWGMMQTDLGSLFLGGGTSSTESDAEFYTVRRETLRVTVTEDGNLESAENTEVKCEIPGGSTILWIIDEGEKVTAGEKLVELDQSAIEDARDQQKGVVDEAKAAKVQAEQNLKAAEIAVTEYRDGTYKQEEQLAQASIEICKENQATSKNLLEHSQKMLRKGFATPLQVRSDEFAVKRTALELAAAETALSVLQEFTKKKMLTELQATADAATALKHSKEEALKLEEKKLNRLENKLDKAVIYAPKDGMVIYANERSRYSSVTIELHSAVKEGQAIIRLPDLSNMNAKVLVNESKIELLKMDSDANLKIGERTFQGKVTAIANQPERGSWGSDIKEYATIVSIEGNATGLKPGMTAEVEVLVNEFPDTLTVPVSAVVEQRGQYFCWVNSANGPERRPLVVAGTNDRKMAITDGVKEGDKVILNPRATVPEAREQEKEEGEEGDGKGEGQDSRGKSGQGKPDKGKGPGARGQSAGGQSAGPAGRPAGPGAGSAGGQRPSGAGGSGQKPYNDKNGDGLITKDEVTGPMKNYFDKLDENGDGAIDQSEFKKAAERRKAAGGSR